MLIKKENKMNNNLVIKVVAKDFNHEFIGTKSEAKKYYVREALAIRNTDTTYATDIRKFSVEQLIWFCLGENNFTVMYRENNIGLNTGSWRTYGFSYSDLLEQEHRLKNDFHNNMI